MHGLNIKKIRLSMRKPNLCLVKGLGGGAMGVGRVLGGLGGSYCD